jgi:hypothetical protein
VNVHTTQYPDGEIRGQISNSISGMMMKWWNVRFPSNLFSKLIDRQFEGIT